MMMHKFLLTLLFKGFLISFILLSFQLKAQNPDTLLLIDINQNGDLTAKEHRALLKRIKASDAFYKRLMQKADSNYISKSLYPLLFRKPQTSRNLEIRNLPANAVFKKYQGDVIRSIRYVKLRVFGSSIYDTIYEENKSITNILNKMHMYTNDVVIDNYLSVKPGQRLDAVKLSDNERMIRNAPIFEDARFIVDPVNKDSVDLILIVKDIFPLGADIKVNSVRDGRIRLYDRNLLGFGHQLGQSFGYKSSMSPSFFLGEGGYIARNIRHSLTDFSLLWSDDPINKHIGMDVSRPFITPELHLAGGLNVTYNEAWLFDEPLTERYRYSNRVFDVWGGYSTIINRFKGITSNRQQAALVTRFYQLDYYQVHHFSLLNMPPMVSVTRTLTAFHILRSEFYQSNMIYGYGRTEDIPYGYHAELILGYEHSELDHRVYSALKSGVTLPIRNAGLMHLQAQLGGYFQKGLMEDGVFKTDLQLISPLINMGKFRVRNFSSISYITGISRTVPGTISMNGDPLWHLFNKYELTGYQRVRGRFESVNFTPYYFMGFRFAAFWYMEVAVLAKKNENFVNQTIYPALGAGIRLRNENLIFSTIQLSLNWYPVHPDGIQAFSGQLSDVPGHTLNENLIDKPEIIEYK